MNDGRARMLIGGVAEASGALAAIVAGEAPEFEPFWSAIANECRALLAEQTNPLPRTVEDLADRIARAFGVGMGSLSDLVLWRDDREERRRVNAQLTALRCKLAELAARLRQEAQAGVVNPLVVRRYLTALESVFLDGLQEEPAHKCRALLNHDEIECQRAWALLDEIASQPWPVGVAYRLVHVAAALRNELSIYVANPGGAA